MSKFNLVCTWQQIQVKLRPVLTAPVHTAAARGPSTSFALLHGTDVAPRGMGLDNSIHWSWSAHTIALHSQAWVTWAQPCKDDPLGMGVMGTRTGGT